MDSRELVLEDLNKFLMETFGLKRKPAYAIHRCNINTESRKNFKIYMRVNAPSYFFPDKIITFANVEFNPNRKGYMSKLIKFFCENRYKYEIEYIGLEQCVSICSKNFAQKYGFNKIEDKESNSINFNYLIKCEDFLEKYNLLSEK